MSKSGTRRKTYTTVLPTETLDLMSDAEIEQYMNDLYPEYGTLYEAFRKAVEEMGNIEKTVEPVVELYSNMTREEILERIIWTQNLAVRIYNLGVIISEYQVFVIEYHPRSELKGSKISFVRTKIGQYYGKLMSSLRNSLKRISYFAHEDLVKEIKMMKIVMLYEKNVPHLYKRQLDHFKRLQEKIKDYHCVIDGSGVGAGKTYVAGALMTSMGVGNSLVVSPGILTNKWKQVGGLFGLKVEGVSYQSLSGNAVLPCHRFLTKTQTKDGLVYDTTVEFDHFIEKGGFLIVDEFQSLKNINSYSESVIALVRRMVEMNESGKSNSRCILMSATPSDKMQCRPFVRLCGFTSEKDIYIIKKGGSLTLTKGWSDIQKKAESIDPKRAKKIYSKSISSKNVNKVLRKVLISIILPTIRSEMPGPKKGEFVNAFYNSVDEESYNQMMLSVRMLKEIAERREKDTGEKHAVGEDLAIATEAQRLSQMAKSGIVINNSIRELERNPQCKIIIFAQYHNVIDKIFDALKKYGAVRLNGQVPVGQRGTNLAKFQEASTKCRVIIANTAVGGMGIDMDDKDGRFPRIVFVLPDYRFIPLHQACGRIVRLDSQSEAKVYFVYMNNKKTYSKKSKEGEDDGEDENLDKFGPSDEVRLIDSIVRKSSITRDYMGEGVTVPFPNEFKRWVEGEDDEEKEISLVDE